MLPETILYCGSFNPIHRGHIAIAEAVVRQRGAAELWFVVSPCNPFKEAATLAPETDRLAMVKLALRSADRSLHMEASDVEFALPKPTRTAHTLEYLRQRFPERRFSLLIGSDNVEGFDRWYRADQIIDRCEVLVYPRPECPIPDTPTARRMTLLEHVPLLPYEATRVRRTIETGGVPEGELLPEVWQYIRSHGLYGAQPL